MKISFPCLIHFDVAIVGGGPAAVVCAYYLRRAGYHVIMVYHRNNQHVDSIELLSGKARRLLEGLFNKSIPKLANGIEINETISLWKSDTPVVWNAICNPWGAAVAVDREVFDQAIRDLVKTNGVIISHSTLVQRVSHNGDIWKLELKQTDLTRFIYANFLVVATGRTVADLLKRKKLAQSSRLVLTKRFKLHDESFEHQKHTFLLESIDNAWWYSLPTLPSGRFTGLCVGLQRFKQRQHSLHAFFDQELRRTRLIPRPSVSESLYSIPIMGRPANMEVYDKVSGIGWLAVGDAAFVPDPLSGMGIEFGIESAMRAAQVIQSGLEASHINYQRWVDDYSKDHNQILQKYMGSIFN
jgi:flavin-dependent dehydrogenase